MTEGRRATTCGSGAGLDPSHFRNGIRFLPFSPLRAGHPPARCVAIRHSASPDIVRLLPYRPPYDWGWMLAFLADHVLPGLEAVDGGRYHRIVDLDGIPGTIEVRHAPDQSALRVVARLPRPDALPAVLARVRRLFDLAADPIAIGAALSRDPALAPLVAARPGLRVPGCWDGFEVAARAVLGQQITVRGATRLAAKLVAALGRPVFPDSGMSGLTHLFPHPDRCTVEAVEALGMPRMRAVAIAGLADALRVDPGLFDRRGCLDWAVAGLRAVPGVGEWTAQYIAMRVLGETDAFLAGDVALQRILAVEGRRPTARALLARAETWRPWRAYAVMHVWTGEAAGRAVGRGKAGLRPEPHKGALPL